VAAPAIIPATMRPISPIQQVNDAIVPQDSEPVSHDNTMNIAAKPIEDWPNFNHPAFAATVCTAWVAPGGIAIGRR